MGDLGRRLSPSPMPSSTSSSVLVSDNTLTTPPPSSSTSPKSSSQGAHLATTMFSTCVPSKTEMEAAMAARAHQAYIFRNTNRLMGVCTENMFAFGLRDYQRQSHVTTKRTTPALLKRRYSIDVITRSRNSKPPRNTLVPSSPSHKRKHSELEVVASTPILFFPSPLRYHDFHKFSFPNPPFNNDIFLRIDTAEITNNEWRYITHTSGNEKWMLDNSLDTSLKVLSHNRSCQISNIGIASSIDSQVCYNPDPEGKEDYPNRFGDKKWIFMPVNDGMGGAVNDSVNGIHWSFVALDRIHKSTHYYDSIFVEDNHYLRLANRISAGMLLALGEDLGEWTFHGEHNGPKQWRDNQCEFDEGACAPIVFRMIDMLIDRICEFQHAGMEEQCSLQLSPDYPAFFRSGFDSNHVRHYMQYSIAVARMHQNAEECARQHDKAAIADDNVKFEERPPLRFEVPQRRPEDCIISHYFDVPQTYLQHAGADADDTDCESELSGAATTDSDESMSSTRAMPDSQSSAHSSRKRSLSAVDDQTVDLTQDSDDESVRIPFTTDEEGEMYVDVSADEAEQAGDGTV